jgi:hypothetical protein
MPRQIPSGNPARSLPETDIGYRKLPAGTDIPAIITVLENCSDGVWYPNLHIAVIGTYMAPQYINDVQKIQGQFQGLHHHDRYVIKFAVQDVPDIDLVDLYKYRPITKLRPKLKVKV